MHQSNKGTPEKDGVSSDSASRQTIAWWTEQSPGAISAMEYNCLLPYPWNGPWHDVLSTTRQFLNIILMLPLLVKRMGKVTLSREADN